MTVLPAVNVGEGDEGALRAQLAAVPEAAWVHLDVADGSMTKNRSWQDAAQFRALAGERGLQVHLMVAEPEAVLDAWLAAGAGEVVVHLDPMLEAEESGAGEPAALRLARLADRCHASGAKLVVGGCANLPTRDLAAHRAHADAFLVLGVTPGQSGQEMAASVPESVAELRAHFADVPVWVDGGVSAGTLPAIRAAGATGAVAASAVFAAENPAEALSALQSL